MLSLVLSGLWGCSATMPPVSMTFVDEQDGRPIAGAHVLFRAGASQGTLTGHGGARTNLFLVEGITDSAGMVHLPGQEFSARPFLHSNYYEMPSVTVFKPGYELLVRSNSGRIIAELEDVTDWQYNGDRLTMRRASGDKDVLQSIESAGSSVERSFRSDGPDVCAWKSVPRFIVAVDRSLTEWKKRNRLEAQQLRIQWLTSPLQGLLANDQAYENRGCGSPRRFFEPYLKDAGNK